MMCTDCIYVLSNTIHEFVSNLIGDMLSFTVKSSVQQATYQQ